MEFPKTIPGEDIDLFCKECRLAGLVVRRGYVDSFLAQKHPDSLKEDNGECCYVIWIMDGHFQHKYIHRPGKMYLYLGYFDKYMWCLPGTNTAEEGS